MQVPLLIALTAFLCSLSRSGATYAKRSPSGNFLGAKKHLKELNSPLNLRGNGVLTIIPFAQVPDTGLKEVPPNEKPIKPRQTNKENIKDFQPHMVCKVIFVHGRNRFFTKKNWFCDGNKIRDNFLLLQPKILLLQPNVLLKELNILLL